MILVCLLLVLGRGNAGLLTLPPPPPPLLLIRSVVPKSSRWRNESWPGLGLAPGLSVFPHFAPRWAKLVEEKKRGLGHELVVLADREGYEVAGGVGSHIVDDEV